jgi:hypothetical protein
MSDQSGQDRRPLRQFSVTLTEHGADPSLSVMLRWRTFPCSAQHWDGIMSARVPWHGGPIQSQQALREAMLALAAEEWQMGPVARR